MIESIVGVVQTIFVGMIRLFGVMVVAVVGVAVGVAVGVGVIAASSASAVVVMVVVHLFCGRIGI